MAGPYTGTGYYNPSGGHCNSHRPPPLENAAGAGFGEDIATRVNQALGNYETFILGKTGNTEPLTEGALFILGNYIINYIPKEMPRYEKVLDRLSHKTQVNVDWVKKLLYVGLGEGRSEEPKEESFQVGIGAMVKVPDAMVKAPLQLQH